MWPAAWQARRVPWAPRSLAGWAWAALGGIPSGRSGAGDLAAAAPQPQQGVCSQAGQGCAAGVPLGRTSNRRPDCSARMLMQLILKENQISFSFLSHDNS